MNETIKTLLSRRSVRAFTNEIPSEKDINEIIQAGLYAPSAMNYQSPVIIAVTNKKMRDCISIVNASIMNKDEGFDPFYGAPVILMVIAKALPNAVYDGTATIVNMMNAAESLGLATCWIHRAKEEMELPFGKDLLSELGLDGEYIGVGHVALGYRQGEKPEPKERLNNRVFWIK